MEEKNEIVEDVSHDMLLEFVSFCAIEKGKYCVIWRFVNTRQYTFVWMNTDVQFSLMRQRGV